jgi:N-acetylneuraminic acid mutarotase
MPSKSWAFALALITTLACSDNGNVDGPRAGDPVLDSGTGDVVATGSGGGDAGIHDAREQDVGRAGASSQPSEPVQRVVRSLPEVRQEHAVVALAGEVYVIGGFTPAATASITAYDPETDSWREIADFPAVLQHANAAVVGDKLYVLGFYVGSTFSQADARVFAYDPVENAWTERRSMPEGSQRASACVAALGTKIYVFGGARATTVSDASAYDTERDEWEPLPALPEPREHCAAAALNRLLYIASGRSGSIEGFQPATWAYHPLTREYEAKAPIPTPRGGAAGAVLDGKLFIFGGEGNDSADTRVFANVEAYDPISDAWQAQPDMLIPRHGFGAASIGRNIYLPGGATTRGFGAVADHTVFSLDM